MFPHLFPYVLYRQYELTASWIYVVQWSWDHGREFWDHVAPKRPPGWNQIDVRTRGILLLWLKRH